METIQLDENLPVNATLFKMAEQIRSGYERQNSQLFCYLDLFTYNRDRNIIVMKEALDRETVCSGQAMACSVTIKVSLFFVIYSKLIYNQDVDPVLAQSTTRVCTANPDQRPKRPSSTVFAFGAKCHSQSLLRLVVKGDQWGVVPGGWWRFGQSSECTSGWFGFFESAKLRNRAFLTRADCDPVLTHI